MVYHALILIGSPLNIRETIIEELSSNTTTVNNVTTAQTFNTTIFTRKTTVHRDRQLNTAMHYPYQNGFNLGYYYYGAWDTSLTYENMWNNVQGGWLQVPKAY